MKKHLLTLLLSIFILAFSKSQNIYTFAGTGTLGFSGDGGPAIAAQISDPSGIAFDLSGNMYFADRSNHRIRKITTSGIISTIAGTGTLGFSGDGGPANIAQINNPYGVAIDPLGNIYFSDNANYRIRKIDLAGNINTIAGTGVSGLLGDGGPANLAQLNSPTGMYIDNSSNIFFIDGNTVRKIDASGNINRVAGDGGYGTTGDGGLATAAKFQSPMGVITDAASNVYIADSYSSRIRMINGSGIINTISGDGFPGYSGDGGLANLAQINNPYCLTKDASGNIYFGDFGNSRVRKINTSGIISTFVGNGIAGFSGDGGIATLAQLSGPGNIAFDPSGNLYISDKNNQRIRIICTASSGCLQNINELKYFNRTLNTFPNPAVEVLQIENQNQSFEKGEIEITNYLGQIIFKLPYKKEINVSELSNGYYIIKLTTTEKQQFHSKFIKE